MHPLNRLSPYILILSCFYLSVDAATNFDQCLEDFRQGSFGTQGGVDNFGHPVNYSDAVGITYAMCTEHCGTGQEPFNWSNFSQQFSSWLLPWVSLVSQLPFYGGTRLTNLDSVVLTVGSPTLAGYSLVLTVLNSRWAYRRFNGIKYPNRHNAARVLNSLQQVPVRVVSENGLLASLIVLPENDSWWEELVERLDCSYTWNIAAATNIAWVVIAFLFTVIDSFMNLGVNFQSGGQGIGSLWMWLLPIIVGWMQVPIASHEKLLRALEKAGNTAYVASQDETPSLPDVKEVLQHKRPIRASQISGDSGLCMWERKEPNYWDEDKTSPIFNYARSWGWADAVEEVAVAFEEASDKARRRIPVNPNMTWIDAIHRVDVHPANRAGSASQVQEYCGYSPMNVMERKRVRAPGALTRAIIASLCGLSLQWGTTVSSVLVLIFTPTVGLGCRSGSYLLYGILSTVVWLMMLISSMLNHYCSINSPDDPFYHLNLRPSFDSVSVASAASNILRRTAVLFATANSVWILVTCVFQFANYFDTCYCNSSVLGLGSRNAYIVITPDFSHINMKVVWVGGMVLGGGCTIVYTLFVALMVEPPVSNST